MYVLANYYTSIITLQSQIAWFVFQKLIPGEASNHNTLAQHQCDNYSITGFNTQLVLSTIIIIIVMTWHNHSSSEGPKLCILVYTCNVAITRYGAKALLLSLISLLLDMTIVYLSFNNP